MATCRWCLVEFTSRNQVFVHVRDTPACAAAANQEDDRASTVLAERARPKVHAAVFLVRRVCSAQAVETCLLTALDAAGAHSTIAQSADDATNIHLLHNLEECGGGDVRGCCRPGGTYGVFVARFECSCTAHTAHCGADVLHRTYSTLAQSDVAVGVWKLLQATLIPRGDKFRISELRVQDHSHLLHLRTPEGAAACTSNALAQVTPTDLSSLVTIVVTTSPMRSDPELDILETTFGSLALAGLEGCRKILVCDHLEIDVAASTTTTKFRGFKKGCLPPEYIQRYRQRLENLREAQWAHDKKIEVLELESWHGFALATLRALELVQTPLVCVIQHDLAFLRRVDFAPIADVLLREQPGAVRKCNFVNFPVCFRLVSGGSLAHIAQNLSSKHTHTHAHTRTHTHARTHMHAHARTHTRAHARSHACTYAVNPG